MNTGEPVRVLLVDDPTPYPSRRSAGEVAPNRPG
jgi:hypothetical protein